MKVLRYTILVFLLISVTYGQNNCLIFDGSDDYITATGYDVDTGNFTVEAWIMPTTYTISGIICQGDYSYGTGFFIDFNANSQGAIRFESGFSSGDNGTIDIGGVIKINQWNHIAVSITRGSSGNNSKIYVNGEIIGAGNVLANDITNTSLHIGKIASAPVTFPGYIDEVRIWNTARTQLEIRQNMYSELSNPAGETNLVAYYKFNESDGAFTATETKNSNNGTLNNMTGNEWSTSSAIFGPKTCLNFDGLNDYINFSNFINFYGNSYESDYTLMFWFKSSASATQNMFYCRENNPNEKYFHIILNPTGNVDFHVRNLYGPPHEEGNITSTGTYNDGKWHHVAARRNGTSHELIIDGVSCGSFNISNNPMVLDIFMVGGMRTDGGSYSNFFNGNIDDLKIYSTALTNEQIYSKMFNNHEANEANLIAYYSFDYVRFLTLVDYAEYKDGTVMNMDLATDCINSDAYDTWLNTLDNDWLEPSNWSRGIGPQITESTGIYNYLGGASPSLGGSTTVRRLYIGSGASTTIQTDLSVTDTYIQIGNIDLSSGSLSIKGNAFNSSDIRLISNSSADFENKPLFE